MSQRTSPLELPAQPQPLPDAHEVSQLMREFAQPLLYVDPEGPADLETLRTAMALAMICWNLPVYEASGSPLYAKGARTLQEVQRNVPRAVGAALKVLLEDRKSKFADRHYLVLVEVTGQTLREAQIVAEARTPKRPS